MTGRGQWQGVDKARTSAVTGGSFVIQGRGSVQEPAPPSLNIDSSPRQLTSDRTPGPWRSKSKRHKHRRSKDRCGSGESGAVAAPCTLGSARTKRRQTARRNSCNILARDTLGNSPHRGLQCVGWARRGRGECPPRRHTDDAHKNAGKFSVAVARLDRLKQAANLREDPLAFGPSPSRGRCRAHGAPLS